MPDRLPFPSPAVAVPLLLLASCAAPGLPPGFAAALAEMPDDVPARLWLDGDRVVAAAVAVGPGAMPRAVRVAVEGIAPGGVTMFAGREWGPAGDGFRVEKAYREGADESFRSVLLRDDGSVLERSHSVPLPDVPPVVLTTALRTGRDVTRCEIVADAERERCWRARVRTTAGWTFVVTMGLDGALARVQREVTATLRAP